MNKHDSQQTELQSESYQPFQLDLTDDAGQAPQRQCADVGRASAVSDAESHWREVNKLTKALRKRGRGSRRRSDQATSQKAYGCLAKPMGKIIIAGKLGCRSVAIGCCTAAAASTRALGPRSIQCFGRSTVGIRSPVNALGSLKPILLFRP